MRLAKLFPAPAFAVLISPRLAVAQSVFPVRVGEVLMWSEYLGMVAIGWGVGVAVWLVSGQPAITCLFVDLPRAWKLRREHVLTSSLPIYKYLLGGALLLVLGAILVDQLWGFWTSAFTVGLLAGVIVGAGHSVVNVQKRGGPVDFLEANQRYLNEDEVPLFTEYDGA